MLGGPSWLGEDARKSIINGLDKLTLRGGLDYTDACSGPFVKDGVGAAAIGEDVQILV